MKPLVQIFLRDVRLAWRRKSDLASVLLFFMIAASLFPLGLGAEASLLRAIAPGVLWVCALLACMLSLPKMFASDYADGTLEQLCLTPQPLFLSVLAKVLAHWATTGIPLVLIAPLIGLQFDMPWAELFILALGLLIGTPILSFIGSIGAALTLGVRGGGALVAVLILPLYIPVLVFGAGAVNAVSIGMSAMGGLSLLGALLVLSLVFAPLAAAAALKIALD